MMQLVPPARAMASAEERPMIPSPMTMASVTIDRAGESRAEECSALSRLIEVWWGETA